MIPTPDYLKQYATAQKQKGNRLSFKIKCTCGCETFTVYEKGYTDEEKQLITEYESKIPDTGWHSIYGDRDSDGKPYWYIKKFWIFKKRIEYPPMPVFMKIEVIKAVCSHCHEEIILFDNRYHGYDGMMSDDAERRKYVPHFRQKVRKQCGIEVTVENETSLEEFNSVMEEQYTPEVYSNSFGWIGIYRLDDKGNKKRIFDSETA